MRTASSLALSTVGIAAFEITAGLLTKALESSEPSGDLLAAGVYLLIAVGAFVTALALRGATWAVVLPCVVATAVMLLLALLGESHGWIVVASTVVFTCAVGGLGRRTARAVLPK